jgi:hypothetical protein
MLPHAVSPGLKVLQLLHSDWQTVGALLSEIRTPKREALPTSEIATLVVGMCARLYVLSRIEMELLYPCLDSLPLKESGLGMHDQMIVDLHALLDTMMGQHSIDPAIHLLAEDAHSLRQFEVDAVYPRCDGPCLESIGDRMVRRREKLLDSFR